MNPPPMGVYFGTHRQGEIEDWGKAGVSAYIYRGNKRVEIGIFADRKTAIGAVAEVVEAAKAKEAPG